MIVCPGCQAQYEDASLRYCGRCGSDMRRDPIVDGSRPDPMIGKVIDGRYRILGKLGQGGMGAVYKVEHLAMGKLAAMKVLHPALSQDAELGARFRREAEAVSRLSHPNTVQVFDFGQPKGVMYLVMELVRGEDLGTILRRDGPMPWSRARPILMQICDALSEAHEAGIVHRDLKPENLLLARGRDGRDVIKVLDFGLAKLRDSEELTQVTARGSLVGTPFYMSPEQIRAEDLDGRSDLYSLGALLYRMVTGEHPFSANTPVAVLTQHLTEALVLPSRRRPDLKIEPIVDLIVGKAMAKSKDDRYASADALRAALDEAPHVSQPIAMAAVDARRQSDQPDQTGQGERVGASPAPERLKREDLDEYERGLRRRRWLGAMVLPLLIASGVAAFAIMKVRQTPQALDVEREPNNTAVEANLIASEKTVRAHIGKCLRPEESDRDYYRFAVENGTYVLHTDLTGVPSMDLKLTVFDADGKRIAEIDEQGPGEGEDLPNVRLEGPGEFFVEVREVWVRGKPATEDETNWYTLTARWHPKQPNQESEPDDAPAQSIPLVLNEPMRGYAGRANDVDYYSLRGEGGGTLAGTLSGVDGVDLRLVALPAGAMIGPPGPLPAGSRVFDLGGAGAPERFDGVAWPAGTAGPLLVVERKDGKSDEDGHWRALVGLDAAYSLTVRLNR